MGPESQLPLTKVLVKMCHMFLLFYTLLVLGVLMPPRLITCDLYHGVHLWLQGSYYCLQRGASLAFLLLRALTQSLEDGCLPVCFCGWFSLPLVCSVGCWLPFLHGNERGCMMLPTYSYNSHLKMLCLCSPVTLPAMATEEQFRMLLAERVTSYWESHRDFCVSISARPSPFNLGCCCLITLCSILCGPQKHLTECEALQRSFTAVAALFSTYLSVWIFQIRNYVGDF